MDKNLGNSNPSFCKQNDGAGSSAAGLRTRFFLFVRARGAKSKVPPIAMGGQRLCLISANLRPKSGEKIESEKEGRGWEEGTNRLIEKGKEGNRGHPNRNDPFSPLS